MGSIAQGGSKRDPAELERIVRSLNDTYNLEIRSPDVTLSPSKRRSQRLSEDQRQSEQIYQRLHFQFYQDWVDKPNGDLDTLPNVSAIHPATQVAERDAFRRCLQKILMSKKPKRISDEYGENGPSRRIRSRLSLAGDQHESTMGSGDPIDQIPFRTNPVSQPNRHGQSAPPRNLLSPNSAATSTRTSFQSTVFSLASGHGTPQTVQSTLYSEHDHDSLEPCAQELAALDESFSMLEAADSGDLVDNNGDCDTDMEDVLAQSLAEEDLRSLAHDLPRVWPRFPVPGFNEAPLAVIWEVTRAAAYCKVDLQSLDLTYSPADPLWKDQKTLWAQLRNHPLFAGKTLPPMSPPSAWLAAIGGFKGPDNMVVVLSAELLEVKHADGGQGFEAMLQTLRLRLGHRLDRRFGADRFLEVLMPSLPSSMKGGDKEKADHVVQWLCNENHYFLGRTWVPFFTRSANKSIKDRNDPGKSHFKAQDQLYFFAVDGINFRPGGLPPLEEVCDDISRTKLSYSGLLEWAIGLRPSATQLVPKLFSRVALSLSRTQPAVILDKQQILCRDQDRESPDGEVMNDGIGRLSPGLAKHIANELGLPDVPSAFQGRLGSAKGMWIIDTAYQGDELWIETYPSQRKWECDFEDPCHRTFEVRNFSKQLKSATLNQQFIPILEAQAQDPGATRTVMAEYLERGLHQELNINVVQNPVDLRAWVQQSRSTMKDTLMGGHDYIPFVGGIPDDDADKMASLLDSGFDAKNQLLNNLIWNKAEKKAGTLKSKLKIDIPCSVYAFMVVDFAGVLEPNEVHLSFSNKFQVEGFSDTLLEEMEILVARAPAHFPSDIQKVRVVSKPELRRLKDVIVFPMKGNRPLAGLLSGGDYDGDMAWVCWDQKIVRNFHNAVPPPPCNFVAEGYLRKESTKFQDLLDRYRDLDEACAKFRYMGIFFNLQPSLLGRCTKYKERLCYHFGNVDSTEAMTLSMLLSDLVDQSKGGIWFSDADWERFRQERLGCPKWLNEPEYSRGNPSSDLSRKRRLHILDYLKHSVAGRVINEAMGAFRAGLDKMDPQQYDVELPRVYNEIEEKCRESTKGQELMDSVRQEIYALELVWKDTFPSNAKEPLVDFQEKVRGLYQRWLDIVPSVKQRKSRTVRMLSEQWSCDPAMNGQGTQVMMDDEWKADFGPWALLKASATFKLLYQKNYKFCWWIAGRQLMFIKAKIAASSPDFTETSPIFMVPEMYGIMMPDKRIVQRMADRRASGSDTDSELALEEVMRLDDNGFIIDDT